MELLHADSHILRHINLARQTAEPLPVKERIEPLIWLLAPFLHFDCAGCAVSSSAAVKLARQRSVRR